MKKYWEIFTDKYGNTIFHPQFIMLSYTNEAYKEILKHAKNKNLIDIGCGRMVYKEKLSNVVKSYIGVDHPKLSKVFNPVVKPDILADITKKIPVKNSTFDIAIMLEVLEFLEIPQKTFSEIKRILTPNGILILTTPFLYPLHDLPYDRARYTKTQLTTFLNDENFKITKLIAKGNFMGFWMQSLNVFLLKRIMDILNSKKNIQSIIYFLFLLLITPWIVITTNIIFFLTKDIKTRYPNYFPVDYLVVATKR